MLLTPAWLGIMHGGGGNISVKLNDSNFGGKRMTLITFFFLEGNSLASSHLILICRQLVHSCTTGAKLLLLAGHGPIV